MEYDFELIEIQDYIRYHIFYGLIGLLWYAIFLFKPIDGLSYTISKIIFAVVVIVYIIYGIVEGIKKDTSEKSVFVNLVISYGIYCMLTYFSDNKAVVLRVMGIAIGFSVLYGFLVLSQRVKKRRNREKIWIRRWKKIVETGRILVSVGLFLLMLYFSGNRMYDMCLKPVLQQAVEEIKTEPVYIVKMKENKEAILNLQEENWRSLNEKERLRTLQMIADIEVSYFGMMDKLTVCTGKEFPNSTYGEYDDRKKEIRVNEKVLYHGTMDDLLTIICHEVFHAYSHKLIELYENTEEEWRSLIVFDKVEDYIKEFKNYEDGESDFMAYYNQVCEQEARNYAKQGVEKYYNFIKDSFLTQHQEAREGNE